MTREQTARDKQAGHSRGQKSGPGSDPCRARFLETHVHTNGAGSVRVECTIENASAMSWTDREPSSGSADNAVAGPVLLGYSVFDAETGLLVMEGGRTAMGDCSPGERREISAEIELPPEDGRYRIWLSPVHENSAWFYERGSEFLEIEVFSTSQGVSVAGVHRTTRRGLLRRRAVQLLSRAFWYPLKTIARHRSLTVSMVRREILGRYRGSMGGALWTVIHPLLLMVAYYFVFSVVLRVRFAPGRGGFVFYFLCGMLPWLAFSEAVGRAPGVVIEYRGFVKRVLFPLEILPVNLTAMGLATELFALAIYLVALITLGPGLHLSALYLPLVLVPQLLLTVGICWFLASLGVFLRDTGQIIGFVLTIWFFVTPICYPAESLPQQWLWLFRKNPVYVMVAAYRAILLAGTAPEWVPLAKLWMAALAAFWAGHAWFFKAKKSFADLV